MAPRAFEKFAGFGPHRSWGLGMWIVSSCVGSQRFCRGRAPPEGGLIVWARFPESTMVPGGVFGLPDPAGDEPDDGPDPDVDLGLDGLDDDLLDPDTEAEAEAEETVRP